MADRWARTRASEVSSGGKWWPSDHVCVTPQVRAATASANSLASERRAPVQAYGPDTCKQGFVWREVRKDDYVCVTPATPRHPMKLLSP
jgi:hypothetical protein